MVPALATEPKYVRLCKGLKDKGILLPETEVYDYINKDVGTDWYQSIYYYNQSHYDEFQKTGTVKGITDVTTDKLVFDLDNEKNPEEARERTVALISQLKLDYKVPEKDIQVYFSGNKGFNVILLLDRYITADLAKQIVKKLSSSPKDITIDWSIYNPGRILRIPATKHPKSGLYKIPLTTREIHDTTYNIRNKATSLENISDDWAWGEVTLPEEFFKVVEKKKPIPTYTEFDLSTKPRHWKNCKWSLLQGNFKAGERHQALMVLAATCRGLGYDKETTYYLCKSALKKQALKSGSDEFPKEELWENIIEQSVFKDGWQGGTYSCKNDPWLGEYCKSLGKDKCADVAEEDQIVLEPKDLIAKFDGFIKNFDENRILTGIPPIDDRIVMTIGQPVGILAAPSVGKTSLALNILNNVSNNNLHSMFFSLDMFNAHVVQKLIQKFTRFDFEKIKHIVTEQPEKAVEYYQHLEQQMKNVHTVAKSGITVEDMRRIIQDYEREHNIKIKVLVVDYLELLVGPFSDETANSAFNARALKDLSTDLECCVIVLLQPQKTLEPNEPILSYRKIKGASLLEQSFRVVLALHRPGFSPEYPEEDKFLGINCVKNTMGPLFSTYVHFDGPSGNVRALTESEEDELKYLQDRIEQRKAHAADHDGWS